MLYNFTVTYTSHSNDTDMPSESSLSRRLGIRTMELVEEPLRDPAGFSFYFRVNGVPIYARGMSIRMLISHIKEALNLYNCVPLLNSRDFLPCPLLQAQVFGIRQSHCLSASTSKISYQQNSSEILCCFQQIKLVMHPLLSLMDGPCLDWHLCAGANLIPLQIFHSQNSAAEYRELLEDAVEANMNMLRIWGGGLYQDDALYDLADEMGLLIWQEAMFACAQYPRDSAFLENVSLSE